MPHSPSTESTSGFDRFPLCPSLRRGLASLNYREPTPIQAGTLPAGLAGRDVLGLAQTGTGKTAAFALPLLEKLNTERGRLPRALVLAPTRELAAQIDAEMSAIGRFTGLKTATIFGGVSAFSQIRALRARPDILVACPGRLLDLMQQGEVRLSAIEVLVLDEADHMFDLGFLPNIRRILAALPARRQNLLFSATMPDEVRRLTADLLNDPETIELAIAKPAETIEHALYPVASERKVDLLQHLLKGDDFASAIVFLRTKHRAKRLAEQLSRLGHQATALHGNLSQPQRDRAMQGFRAGRFNVLVATDIAARGLDIAHVSHVINFDVPNTADAYTHRIGRTGRAERHGKAFTFVGNEDRGAVRDIERKLGQAIPRRRIDGLAALDPTFVDEREHNGAPHPRTAPRPPRAQPHRPNGSNGRPAASTAPAHHRRAEPGFARDERNGSDRRPPRSEHQAAEPLTARPARGPRRRPRHGGPAQPSL